VRHVGQGVGEIKTRAIQRAAWRARRRRAKETRDAVSGVVCRSSARESNERFTDQRSGWAGVLLSGNLSQLVPEIVTALAA
jgi:hypothetical protein